jgi:PIN domain nuclease of toxin-antitoxin system
MIVLDTCTLLWWTLGSDELSEKATQACSLIPDMGALLPSSAICEIGVKMRRGRLDVGSYTLSDYVRLLKEITRLEIVPIDADLWVESLSLDWDHSDPMDRLVVSPAKTRGLPLFTRDVAIRKFYDNVIW